ncbi:helix-turn-helix domain-containing protein [Tissierellaceae bacterium HCP3S3_D8]
MNKIGNRIKELRELNNISANKLAISLDIAPSNISKIENGISKPSLDLLMSICDYFKISMSEFFSDGINTEILPNEVKELLNNLRNLTPEQLEAVNSLIKDFKK